MPTFKNDPKKPTRKGGYGMDFFKPIPNNSTMWGRIKTTVTKTLKTIKK